MNDDIDGAWAGLKRGDSSFHDLGEAVTFFMRSVLGFEKDVMAQAATKLADCETRAAADHRRALRNHHQHQHQHLQVQDAAAGGRGEGGRGSSQAPRVYAPGTEYDLVRAETQLMGAVVGVLHESLVEAMRSFYKLRKAYLILEGIIAMEAEAVRDGRLTDERGLESGSSSGSEEEFVDAKEKPSGQQTPITGTTTTTTSTAASSSVSFSATTSDPLPAPKETLESNGTLNSSGTLEAKTEALQLVNEPSPTSATPQQQRNGNTANGTTASSSSSTKPSSPSSKGALHARNSTHDPIDVFIHSGANMCFGIILLILSLTPPSFSRVLSIVGFHGDRARGVRMLWRSAAHHNVNGALAGMVLLGYYNGLLGAVDILPDARHDVVDDDDNNDAAPSSSSEAVGPPIARCEALLADLRARYPDSQLWRVEEARLLANERRLADAIALLRRGPESKMKQVAALNNFELAVDAMIAQDWLLMRDTFLRCLEVNDWSPAMYYYMAGCASLELYRDAVHASAAAAAAAQGRGGDDGGETDKDGDESSSARMAEALRQKAKAEEFLRKAPQVGGKKRLMARQLPIETFIQRKLAKWEARAKALGVPLADAVGTSPAMEMCYMWSGHKRMAAADMARGLANLSWARCTAGLGDDSNDDDKMVARIRADKDEMAVWAVSSAALLRSQGKLDEARALLEEHVTAHDR
ncbi:Mitochondrial outer membrane protein iml2, variant 2 [Purpureocillium takamizusanense]|nr:Mitochondrial outer membrane protein iml2, variant 2 [Purpureocillium takamizusanense]UNI23740.1 Mitochondrial outer membrane protein iml2, variant 2 [Purpureocillium takamizusanense]